MIKVKLDAQIKENAKKYLPMTGILIYLLFIIAAYFVGDIIYGQIKSQRDQIKQQKILLAQEKQTIQDLNKLKNEMPEFPNKVSILDKVKFGDTGVGGAQLLAQLDKIAKDSGVNMSSVNPSGTGQSISVSLLVNGTSQNCMNYLKNLENNLLIMNISSISLTKTGENLSMNISLTTAA